MIIDSQVIDKLAKDESWVGIKLDRFLSKFENSVGDQQNLINNFNLKPQDAFEELLIPRLKVNLGLQNENYLQGNNYYKLSSDQATTLSTTSFLCESQSTAWIDLTCEANTEFLLKITNISDLFLKLNLIVVNKVDVNIGILIENRGSFRLNLTANLDHANANLLITTMASNLGLLSICNRQIHLVESCKSDTLFKFVGHSSSYSHFWGLIEIMSQAQNSDAYQLARAMLLSSNSQGNLTPNLRIGANNVRCTHGASYSTINPLDIFYLASRGLDEEFSRKILTQGFLVEGADRLPQRYHQDVENFVQSLV